MTRRCAISLGLLLLTGPLLADEPTIDQLIGRLGASSFREREQATEALVARGRAAVPALRRAAASESPEVRWRAEAALQRILPRQTYYDALRDADAGRIAEAVARIRTLLPHLPADLRPQPAWTVQILEQIAAQGENPETGLTTAISWHNLHCLLREAGVASGRVLARAREEYRRIGAGDRRALRLLAVLDTEAGEREAAERHWAAGAPTEGEADSYWTEYDFASYFAARGDVPTAMRHLARAIVKSPRARDEARRASDFHMLVGHPEFESLLAGELPPEEGEQED